MVVYALSLKLRPRSIWTKMYSIPPSPMRPWRLRRGIIRPHKVVPQYQLRQEGVASINRPPGRLRPKANVGNKLPISPEVNLAPEIKQAAEPKPSRRRPARGASIRPAPRPRTCCGRCSMSATSRRTRRRNGKDASAPSCLKCAARHRTRGAVFPAPQLPAWRPRRLSRAPPGE
jgi:hypothetical protein